MLAKQHGTTAAAVCLLVSRAETGTCGEPAERRITEWSAQYAYTTAKYGLKLLSLLSPLAASASIGSRSLNEPGRTDQVIEPNVKTKHKQRKKKTPPTNASTASSINHHTPEIA